MTSDKGGCKLFGVKTRIALPEPCAYDRKYSDHVLPEYIAAIDKTAAVEKIDVEVVILEPPLTVEEVVQQIGTFSAVLLPSCGADVDPQKYGEPTHPRAAPPDPVRAALDELLLQDAYSTRKPILGICYGLQSLVAWHGGKLIQDIETQVQNYDKNHKDAKHQVSTWDGSKHLRYLGNDSEVKSKHRQAVAGPLEKDQPKLTLSKNSLGHEVPGTKRLKICVTDPIDNVVEAVEGTEEDHYVVGVQWHPERDFDENARKLFKGFIEAAARHQPQKEPTKLQEFGDKLHKLFRILPKHVAITDTLDYVLGALYGLVRAQELGFRDREGEHFASYRSNLAIYASRTPRKQPINTLWRAGFYFNSAIQRMASAFDRLPQLLGGKEKHVKPRMEAVKKSLHVSDAFNEWEKIYDEVNTFKHDPEGVAKGRTVEMEVDAIRAFGQLLYFIEKGKDELIKIYT